MTGRVQNCLVLALGLLALASGGGRAFAQGAPAGVQPTELGKFKDWSAYSAPVKNGKVCYALAQPKSRKPAGVDRKDAYFFISNRPKDSVKNEISVIIGFPVRPNSDVELTADKAGFKLYTRADGAFMRSTDEEITLVKALRTSRRDLTIKSTSARGSVTTDTYSLAGISAALDKIDRECR